MAAKNSGATKATENDVYIDKVLDRRVRGGILEYRVRIKGNMGTFVDWFAKENLTCHEIIALYETQRQAAIGDKIRQMERSQERESTPQPKEFSGFGSE